MKRLVKKVIRVLLFPLTIFDCGFTVWLVLICGDTYDRMIHKQGDMSLQHYLLLLSKNREFISAFITVSITTVLILFFAVTQKSKKTVRQILNYFFVFLLVFSLLMFFLWLALCIPDVSSMIVPFSTVIRDKPTIVFFILFCVGLFGLMFNKANTYETYGTGDGSLSHEENDN